MKNLSYEDYLADPAVALARIQREAQRGRAAAINDYLFVPLAQLCGRLLAIRGVKLRLDPRVNAARGVFQ